LTGVLAAVILAPVPLLLPGTTLASITWDSTKPWKNLGGQGTRDTISWAFTEAINANVDTLVIQPTSGTASANGAEFLLEKANGMGSSTFGDTVTGQITNLNVLSVSGSNTPNVTIGVQNITAGALGNTIDPASNQFSSQTLPATINGSPVPTAVTGANTMQIDFIFSANSSWTASSSTTFTLTLTGTP
jgi:hypothetical protein